MTVKPMRTIKITRERGFGSVMLEVGQVLRELREATNLTWRGLAAASQENGQGVSRATVTNLERGDGNVTLRTLRALCLAMGMEIEIVSRPASKYKRRLTTREAG